MDILDRIKKECKKHNMMCYGCVFLGNDGHCVFELQPDEWNTDAIRDALGEEGQIGKEVCESVQIDVPKKFPGYSVRSLADNVDNCSREKINEIIDCIEKMKAVSHKFNHGEYL